MSTADPRYIDVPRNPFSSAWWSQYVFNSGEWFGDTGGAPINSFSDLVANLSGKVTNSQLKAVGADVAEGQAINAANRDWSLPVSLLPDVSDGSDDSGGMGVPAWLVIGGLAALVILLLSGRR